MTTPRQLEEALRDWIPAKKLDFRPGWNTRGTAWYGGLRGLIVHDLVGVDQGAIDWTYAPSSPVPYCNSVTTHTKVIVNSCLSVWHAGTGGPWPAAGIPKDQANAYCWGIENAVWGRSVDEYSDEMRDLTSRTICAVREAAGIWPRRAPFSRVVRHASWTDGGSELGMTYWLPTRGRKVDTKLPLSTWRADARARWKSGRA